MSLCYSFYLRKVKKMKRKLISVGVCVMLTVTSTVTGVCADTAHADVSAADTSESVLAETAAGTEASTAIDLTQTDTSKWKNGTDSNRNYIAGSDDAEVTAEVPGGGWLLFDWKMENSDWKSNFVFSDSKTGEKLKSIAGNNSSTNKWATEAVRFDEAASVSWKNEVREGQTSNSEAWLSNVRFVSSQTVVNGNISGNGAISINGRAEGSSVSAMVDPGSTVTLTAKETGSDIFKEWQDDAGKTLSTSLEYKVNVYDEELNVRAIFASVFNGEGTLEKPYEITAQSDLEKLGELCKGGNTLTGKYFVLQNDVTVDSSFKGISSKFNGIFDGNGKKISGFNAETRGLFESLESNAEVKNLKVVDAKVTASDEQSGIIAGNSSGKISGCDVTGTLNTADKNAGGIVGYLGGSIDNCTFSGTITSTYKGGYTNAATAGIAGNMGYNTSINACMASGKITGNTENFSDAGGIVGLQTSTSYVTNCVSSMDITGYQNLGGIVGRSNSSKISGCYSKGNITGTTAVGGLIGSNESAVTMTECYSVAAVSASDGIAGGIFGHTAYDGSAKNVVAVNKLISGKTIGRIAGNNDKRTWGSFSKTELTDNYAFSAMAMTKDGESYSPAMSDRGADTINGQDIDADTLKDTSAVAECFSSWDKDTWIIEAGKLPVLKAITSEQSSELPSHISGKGETPVDPEPNPGEDPSDSLTPALKDALLADGETNVDIVAAVNMKEADGNKIVIHKGGNSTYADDVYAGGEGLLGKTVNGVPEEGKDTSEGSFTAEWTGPGYLVFDYIVMSKRGSDRFMISVDGADETDFAKGGITLYSGWERGVYHVDGATDQKHTAKLSYYRSKWGNDDDQFVIFDRVRFVKDNGDYAGINAAITDGATEGGCSVTSNVADLASVAPGTKVTLTANVDENKGWMFRGWKVSADSTDYISNSSTYDVTVYTDDIDIFAEFEKPFDGNGTVESPYLINSYNDLKKLSDDVNSGIKYEGRSFKQTADIDMLGKQWVPIGITVSKPGQSIEAMTFGGNYDGDGKTISNMMAVSEIEAGLFGNTMAGTTLKNINIVDSQIMATVTDESVTNKSYVGFIAACSQSNILNCTVKNSKASGIVNVAGIAGNSSYMGQGEAVIENCGIENTTILATGVWDNAYAAGIAGACSSTAIKNCYFTGKATGYGRYVAGITGKSFSDITGCYVKADITSYRSEKSNIDANAVAGIVATAPGGTVSDCYVIGNVTGGRLNVGGIVGKQSGDTKVINCYVVGNIKAGDSSAGGISGSAAKESEEATDSACVKNSLYIGQTVTADAETTAVARIVGSNSAKKPAELAGNYAFVDVKLASAGKDVEVTNKGADQLNGADITKAQINAAPTAAVFADWSRDVWNIEAGKLPTLKNIEKSVQTGEIPAYAKESSSGGGGGSSSGGSSSGGNSGTTTPTKPDQNPSNGGTTTPAKSFDDVAASSWYNNAVKYVAENGIMNGVSDKLFAPDQKVSRAMFVQILYNMENKPAANGAVTFTDVKQSAWYRDAVAWAASNGIVTGVSSTVFAPEKSVTREQFAAMLYRYASYKGTLKAASGDLSGYADSSAVSSYAAEAMKWAVGNGIITGKTGNKLDPKGGATRAEAAAMIVRYLA